MVRVALPFGIGTPEDKRESYRGALRKAGIGFDDNPSSLAGLDGLLLAGGDDVDPALYHAERHPETEDPDPARDQLEIALLAAAIARDLPVLGICRGLQLLNVAMGGTLTQHIEGHKCPKQPEVHPVQIAPGSKLEAILGAREYVVNSRHHQCVGDAAPGVTVTAQAPDGVVEALEIPDLQFVLAVQWHPEARTYGPDLKIFAAFRDALYLTASQARNRPSGFTSSQ